MDSSALAYLNFSSQESLFPEISSDVNAFEWTLDAINQNFLPNGADSGGMLAQYLLGIIILGFGIILSLATLMISWINARKSGKSFNIIRKTQRIEGTYYTAENIVFIPLTMFFYWISLFGQMIVMMMFTRFGRSMYNTSLWRIIPFFIMFIQGHGFAFSILIGGIITSDNVWTSRKLRLPSAWILNFLQIAIAIATIATSIYYGIQSNNISNEAWRLYTTAKPIIEAAADSWVANEPLNPLISEPAYIAMAELVQPSVGLVNNLRKTLIVWLFVAGLPLLTLIIAAGIVLQAVHSYIKVLNSDISREEENEAGTAVEMSSSVVNSSLWTLESKRVNKSYGLHKSLRQMQSLEKKLALRMFAVCSVSITYTIIFVVLIAKYHYVAGSTNTQLGRLFYVISVAFPWTSILYGSVVIVAWFRDAWKEFREARAEETVMTLRKNIGGVSSSYTDPTASQTLCDKEAALEKEKYAVTSINIKHTSYTMKEELQIIPMKTFKGNPVAY